MFSYWYAIGNTLTDDRSLHCLPIQHCEVETNYIGERNTPLDHHALFTTCNGIGGTVPRCQHEQFSPHTLENMSPKIRVLIQFKSAQINTFPGFKVFSIEISVEHAF